MMNCLILNICCACNSDHKCANSDTSRAKTGGNEINCNFTIRRHLNNRNIDIIIGIPGRVVRLVTVVFGSMVYNDGLFASVI